MKRLLRAGIGLAVLGVGLWALKIAWAVPFDGQAVPDAKRLGELLKRPPGERQISAEEVQRCLGLLAAPAGSREGGTSDRRICAMLLLAYATDAPSLEVLRKEAAGAESGGLLSGVAAYAVILREHRACSDEDLLGVLCYHLGLAKNPSTRMFLANRLWSDYGARAEWVIYEAAKTETDMFVKADLLYYVSRTKNVELARAAVASDWSACGDIPEDYAYFLALITPGRKTAYEHMLRIALEGALARTAGASTESPGEETKVELQGFLELRAGEGVAGEPLVVTVGLKNVGDSPFITTYACPGVFHRTADVSFTVTTLAGAPVLTYRRWPTEAVVQQLHPDLVAQLGDRAPAIRPGEAVIARRTVPLVQTVDNRRVWLKPGRYKIQAKIRIQRMAEDFMTAAETFTVKPLAPEDQGVLSIFTPDLAQILGGDRTIMPKRTAVADAKAEELREKFSRAPHRQYLDFHLLGVWRGYPTPQGDQMQMAKANAYLEEFPKSPYVDDVLWRLVRLEAGAGESEKAAAHLETLLRDYPDSPLKQEAEELQTKRELQTKLIKEARERAAARKAAKEKKAALEGKPAPSEDNGAGLP